MIEIFDSVFKLSTHETSYVFALTEQGHAEHIYYGKRLPDTDISALRLKNTIMLGTTVERKEIMNMKNLFNRAIALVCAVLMMISLFALPAFAHEGEDHDHAEEAVQEGLSTAAIVWIVIGGVLVVAGVVLGIKYREKIAKALRVYKSEFKKVSWLSWKDTKKSSLVVLGVLAACALVICLLDLGLYNGLLALIQALRGLFS